MPLTVGAGRRILVDVDAVREAEAVLDRVWRPVYGDLIPVDPAWIANRLGLVVLRASLDDDLAGMLYKSPGRDATIYLNDRDSVQRQRFTCAHEIGHYAKRGTVEGPDEWGFLDRRNRLSSTGTDPAERWANLFAATLLMPRRLVSVHYRRQSDVLLLAYEFGVSAEAMGIRLRTLGLGS